VFPDVVCAVDGSRGSLEAVRQAIALSGPLSVLRFVAVHYEGAADLGGRAALGERSAREALGRAVDQARRIGLHPTGTPLSGRHVAEALREQTRSDELLVLGSHGASRLGGAALGSTATEIVHRSAGPVLLARRSPDAGRFPRAVLLATDGSPGSWPAARLAAELVDGGLADLRVANVSEGVQPERRRQVLEQLALLEGRLGRRPPVHDKPGPAAARICQAAQSGQAALIVIGRDLSAAGAPGGVSERVAHRAPCSVLLVPAKPHP
jgi:nucleotide-binding universal stress UspA family protein